MNATDPRAQALDDMPSPKTDPQARPTLGRVPATAWTVASPTRAAVVRRLSERAKPAKGKSPKRAPRAWRKSWRVA